MKRTISLFVIFIMEVCQKLISPIIDIRIGLLRGERIGHLIANTEYWLRKRKDDKSEKKFFCLFISNEPANKQILSMIKRANPTILSPLLHKILFHLKSIKNNSTLWSSIDKSGWEDARIWNEVPPQLKFSTEDDKLGEEILNQLQIKKNKYICYFARDADYLNQVIKSDSSYHDYRNADINNLTESLKWLNENGYQTLRMGSVVKGTFAYQHPLNIDYAKNFRTDFGDAYLIPHGKFFIGDTSGIYYFAEGFNKPHLQLNLVPCGLPNLLKIDMYMPKKYFNLKENRLMTFLEIFQSGAHLWFKQEQYNKADIQLIENSPDEIFGAIKEMIQWIDGNLIDQEEDKARHEKYVKMFTHYHPQFIHYPRISHFFLRKYQHLL